MTQRPCNTARPCCDSTTARVSRVIGPRPRNKLPERPPYALFAYRILALNYHNRVGLIQSDQSFNIAAVEGMLEEPVYFRGIVCRHSVLPCRVRF